MLKTVWIGALAVALLLPGAAQRSEPFELATVIERSVELVQVDTEGYARLNLVRMEVNHTGEIALNGRLSVEGGTANVVMWSKGQGKYYFSRMPDLQGFDSDTFSPFAIPFSSPEHPVTEVIVNVELPSGGTLRMNGLDLDKR